MRVEVYRNLRKQCWSIRYKGRVIAHKQRLTLRGCKLVVQPAGRERVRREKRKNVHAFIRGMWDGDGSYVSSKILHPERVYYNPYRDAHFMCNGIRIYEAAVVSFNEYGAWT